MTGDVGSCFGVMILRVSGCVMMQFAACATFGGVVDLCWEMAFFFRSKARNAASFFWFSALPWGVDADCIGVVSDGLVDKAVIRGGVACGAMPKSGFTAIASATSSATCIVVIVLTSDVSSRLD